MKIAVTTRDNVVVLTAHGQLDALTAPGFDKHIAALSGNDLKGVVVDCAGLEYISSAGLRSILALAKQVHRHGGRLAICALRGPVKDVFKMTGLHTMLAVFDDDVSAIASVQSVG